MASLLESLALYMPVVSVFTVTPGPDTLLVLRSTTAGGARTGTFAALGVGLGCTLWTIAAAVGLAALIASTPWVYGALKWGGAAYLVWVGGKSLLHPRARLDGAGVSDGATPRGQTPREGFVQGLVTNLLNPKVGIFYVTFLPQFVPAGAPVAATMLLLGAIHGGMGAGWLVLVARGLGALSHYLERPGVVGWLDRISGALFIAFGLRLALG